MGGLVCSACNPPRTDADCVQRLVIRGGVWDDAENPFDFQQEPDGPAAATTTPPQNTNATAAQQSATNFDEATTSELLPRNSRKVGEPLLDLEIDFFMAWPDVGMPEVVNRREIGREPAAKGSKTETGLPELSVQKSGFVGGFVRRGEGFNLSVDPPHNNAPLKTQFAVGLVVRLLRRLETFRGIVHPRGGYLVSSSGKDFWGCPLVALSLGGAVVVSGLVADAETIAVETAAGKVGEEISVDDLIG